MVKTERNSAHELLRIFAMFMIVWYHLISYYLYFIPHADLFDNLCEAMLPTLHVGVILFVLISGYYGIKASVSGFLKLFMMVLIYYLPIEIVRCVHHNGDILQTLQFISNTPYWFIRTYLYLYLLSPILNKYLATVERIRINTSTILLCIIAIYFGTTHGDPSLSDGKNLVNFMFLYFLGNTLSYYKDKWLKVKSGCLLVAYVVMNIITFSILMSYGRESPLGGAVWNLSFPYCSVMLIISATLLFMLFSKLQIHSKFVNAIASSTFAIYLIHCQPALHKYLVLPACEWAANYPPPDVRTDICSDHCNYVSLCSN